jgi:hypothetical protein
LDKFKKLVQLSANLNWFCIKELNWKKINSEKNSITETFSNPDACFTFIQWASFLDENSERSNFCAQRKRESIDRFDRNWPKFKVSPNEGNPFRAEPLSSRAPFERAEPLSSRASFKQSPIRAEPLSSRAWLLNLH